MNLRSNVDYSFDSLSCPVHSDYSDVLKSHKALLSKLAWYRALQIIAVVFIFGVCATPAKAVDCSGNSISISFPGSNVISLGPQSLAVLVPPGPLPIHIPVVATAAIPLCGIHFSANFPDCSITVEPNGPNTGTICEGVLTSPLSGTMLFTGGGQAGFGFANEGGVSVAFGQVSAVCTFGISPTTKSFDATGGTDSVDVIELGSNCTYSSSSNNSWISIISGATGLGHGTVVYSVDGNTSGAARTGTMTIGGQTFTVTQQSAGCTFTISPNSQTFTSTGGSGSISVTASAPNCPWTSDSTVPWITLVSGAAGTGDGAVQYSVSSKVSGGPRTAALVVAEQIFTVNQSAVPSQVEILDPVPALLCGGPQVISPASQCGGAPGTDLLSAQGQAVEGIAADGTSQLLVRIAANSVGDQFTVTLVNDQSQSVQSTSSLEDGGLDLPGSTDFSQSALTIVAINSSSGPNAFAVYRAPVDFGRLSAGVPGSFKAGSCRGVSGTDDQLPCRFVALQVHDISAGTTTTTPITIVRPPVVLIHGLWDDRFAWDDFAPLFSNGTSDPRFFVKPVDYSSSIGSLISATNPSYPFPLTVGVRANALGFRYNVQDVSNQIQSWIQAFKSGTNPVGILVADVQADIVAHSMGGDIARTLPLLPTFLSNNTFSQGNIHKAITIDTPHLGTPLASQLLSSQNGCVRLVLAAHGNPALESVTLSGRVVSGAVGDLQGDGFGGSLSTSLRSIAASGERALPTALIAGVTASTNLSGLNTDLNAGAIRAVCGDVFKNPLAVNLTSQAWPTVFGQSSDGIVPLTSQLNNLSACSGCQLSGFVHSGGTESLGFFGPSILPSATDQNNFSQSVLQQIVNQVINLLNTPVTQTPFKPLNP